MTNDQPQDTPVDKGVFNVEEEINQIVDDYKELLIYNKPANLTLYVYNTETRILSFTLTGQSDTYLKELAATSMFLSLFDHPKVVFIFKTLLPYMGGVEQDSVVTGFFDTHEDLDVKTTPYRVEGETFVDMTDELQPNAAVSPVGDEILVTLKTVKLAHYFSKDTMVLTCMEFLSSLGIDFCFYGNVNRNNLEDHLGRYSILEDVKEMTKVFDSLRN